MAVHMQLETEEANKRPPKPAYKFGGKLPRAFDRLRDVRQWVTWDYTWNAKKRKWDKPPCSAHTGKLASINDPYALGTFEQAAATAQRRRMAGVGFLLKPGDDLTGGDLDDCVTDSGSLSPLAAEVIERGETYAEYSPSAEGIRFLASGKVPYAMKDDKLGVEMYGTGRYLTITGNQVEGTPDEIRPAPNTIARLQEVVAASKGEKPKAAANGHAKPAGDDFFQNVNAAALSRCDQWVPTLHPTAKKERGSGAWRVKSTNLGRHLEEDLSYHAKGIQDFGKERGLTAIDAVIEYGSAPDAISAAMWLCRQIGVEPASLGWKGAASSAKAQQANGKAKAESAAPSSEWPDPVPLPTALPPVASFDYGMLPLKLQPWVRDISERMQCPPDYVAVTSMVALGAVVGRKIALRPKRDDNWAVTPNLWGLCVGPPGVMKSPAQDEGLKPLRALAAAARAEFEAAKAVWDVQEKVAKAQAHNNEKEAAKKLAKDPKAIIEDLLKPVVPGSEEPVLKRYVSTNCTYEALAVLMQQNPNGMLVDRDEMLALLDRLDEEGHADERGFYLSGWNGNSPYTVDRIGRGFDLHVEAVCISTIGGTQPARLSQYLEQTRRGGRNNDGLIQRFGMLVWPDISPTWENVDRKPDKEAAAAAFKVFERLDAMDWRAIGAKRDMGFGGEEEGLPYLRLSERAHATFVEWRTQLELRLRSGEIDPMMESHLAKYRKVVPALALIIHLTDAGEGSVNEVGPISMEQALTWATYLETHAIRAYASSNLAATAAAEAIIGKVKSGHLKAGGFSSREVWRPKWSRLTDRDTVMAALKLLEDYDWLVATKVETNGRTATVYQINPKVMPQ